MVDYDLIIAIDTIYKGEHRVTISDLDHMYMFGKGKLSVKHTLWKSEKAVEQQICLSFFKIGTMLASHVGCWMDLMK